MNNYYHPPYSTPNELSEAESYHCAQVLKQKVGDIIGILNGEGDTSTARITDIEKKKVSFQILETKHAEPVAIKLYFGILKTSERMEWLVEKATEIGVSEIIPFISDQAERSKINLEKLQKVAIAAVKQSGNSWLPRISAPLALKKIISSEKIISQKYITLLAEKEEYISHKNLNSHISEIHLLIGPEGDFSKTEIDLALKNDWKPISLSSHVLRSETAAITALVQAHIILQQIKSRS